MIAWLRRILLAIFKPRSYSATFNLKVALSAMTEIDRERLSETRDVAPESAPARRWCATSSG